MLNKQVITIADPLSKVWVRLVGTERLDLSNVYRLGVIQPICEGKTLAQAAGTFSTLNIGAALDAWYNPATTRSRATKQYITPARVKDTIPGCNDPAALLVHHVLARAGLTSYVPEFEVDFPFNFGSSKEPNAQVLSNLIVATQFYSEVFVPEVTRLIADVQSCVRDDLVTRNARYIGNLTYAELSRIFKTWQLNINLKAEGGVATTERFFPTVCETAMLDVATIDRRSLRNDRSIANLDLVRDEMQYICSIANLDAEKVAGRKVTSVDVGAVKTAAEMIKAYLASKFAVHVLKAGSSVMGRFFGFLAHEGTPATPYVTLGKAPLFTAATAHLGHFAAKVQLSQALNPAEGLIRRALEPIQSLLDNLGSFQEDLYKQHILTAGVGRSYVKGLIAASAGITVADKIAFLSEATGLKIVDEGKETIYQLPSVKKFMGQGQTGWGMLTYDRTLPYSDLDEAVADAILSEGVRFDSTPAWPFPSELAAEIQGALVDDMRKGSVGRIVQPQDVRAKVYVPGTGSAYAFKATEAARSCGLTKTTLLINNAAELQAAKQAKHVLLQLAAAVPNSVNFDDQLLYSGVELLRIGDSAFRDHAEMAMESCGLHSNERTRLVGYERAYKRCRVATATWILIGLSHALAPDAGELLRYVCNEAQSTAKKNNINILDLA